MPFFPTLFYYHGRASGPRSFASRVLTGWHRHNPAFHFVEALPPQFLFSSSTCKAFGQVTSSTITRISPPQSSLLTFEMTLERRSRMETLLLCYSSFFCDDLLFLVAKPFRALSPFKVTLIQSICPFLWRLTPSSEFSDTVSSSIFRSLWPLFKAHLVTLQSYWHPIENLPPLSRNNIVFFFFSSSVILPLLVFSVFFSFI